MAFNFNKVILGGRLTADPEFKITPSGVSVVNFGLAVNRRAAQKPGEETPADFLRVQAWKTTADFISKYFHKSSPICIMGRIQTESWIGKDGKKQFATYIVADEAHFVESKAQAAVFPAANEAGQYVPEGYGTAPANAPKFEELGKDDELPF